MKLPLEIVLNSQPAVRRLTEQIVPAPAALRILASARTVIELCALFDENRTKLGVKYGKQVGTTTWEVSPDAKPRFETDLNNIRRREVEIPDEVLLKPSDIMDARLSAGDMGLILYLIPGLTFPGARPKRGRSTRASSTPATKKGKEPAGAGAGPERAALPVVLKSEQPTHSVSSETKSGDDKQ